MKQNSQNSRMAVECCALIEVFVSRRIRMATRRKFHSPAIDPDLLLAWGILAFNVFLGVAAVGFYAGTVSNTIMEQTAGRSTTALGK